MSLFRTLSMCSAILFVVSAAATAQTVNTLSAALSVNGTGKVDAVSGLVVPTQSQLSPAPPGGAPLYRHRAQALAATEIRVQGQPGRAVILVAGTPQPPQNVGAGFLEIAIPGMLIVADGLTPTNLLNASATTNSVGAWTLIAGNGLPPGTPTFHLQAAVVDPTSPIGIRLSGSVTVETQNSLDAVNRNLLDAIVQPVDNPLYGFSLFAPGFLMSGQDAASFLFNALDEDDLAAPTYLGALPNATNLPAPPAGAPAPGQTAVYMLELEHTTAQTCPNVPTVERFRAYDFQAVESLGAWKLLGDQRQAEMFARVAFRATTAAPVVPDAVYLTFEAESEDDAHGGIQSISVTGPQLGAVNGSGQSTTSASGTVNFPTSPFWDGVYAEVQVGAAGTSRAPLVEDGTGPRDVYTVVVHWNDSTSSPPYTMTLRSSVDVAVNAAQADASIPGLGTPTGILTGAGTPGATLAFTFAGGAALPAAWSQVRIHVNQGGSQHRFDGLQLASPGSTTLNLCVPGLAAGVATFIDVERRDVFGSAHERQLTMTF